MSLMLRLAGLENPSLGDPDGHFWVKCSTLILADPSIPDAEKLALLAIGTLAGPTGVCQATNETLGFACGKDGETFSRLARRLESRGLIARERAGVARVIRLNFGFRGRVSDPGRSAGVLQPLDPAEAPAILRLGEKEEDLLSERSASSAEVVKGPPPPPTEAVESEISQFDRVIPRCDEPLPVPESLPEEIARFLPTNMPANATVTIGPRRHRSADAKHYRLPLSTADLRSPEVLADVDRLMRSYPINSTERDILTIVKHRHRDAWWAVTVYGKTLPPGGEDLCQVSRIIDIEPQSVEVKVQEGGLTLALEVNVSPPGSPVGHAQF